MNEKNLLDQQLNHVSSDALNTPSKAQEQMEETSNPNNTNNSITQDLHGADLPISDVYKTTNKK